MVACTFDWLHGPGQDLLDLELQESILRAAEASVFAGVGLGPICASFSTAITPPIRCSAYPESKPGLNAAFALKVSQGNAHAAFVVRLVRVLKP